MDPTATLARIRDLITTAHADDGLDDVAELIALVEALDEWLSKGGFPPMEWEPPFWPNRPRT